MLMADFVPDTNGGTDTISKGVRRNGASRDLYYDETDGDYINFGMKPANSTCFALYLSGTADSATSFKIRLPSFGTNFVHRGYDSVDGVDLYLTLGGGAQSETTAGTTEDASSWLASSSILGVYNWGVNAKSGQTGNTDAFEIVSPIHTSSHYQTFETPFLHELVGGDRNMEQTNLVVTPDGKTWDEVTRDTSYIGDNESGFVATVDGVSGGFNNTIIKPDVFRGHGGNYEYFDCWNKDFAIAYDRFICLKEGKYRITYTLFSSANNGAILSYLQLNGSTVGHANRVATVVSDISTGEITFRSMGIMEAIVYLKRGDFICAAADSGATIHGGTDGLNKFHAERIN